MHGDEFVGFYGGDCIALNCHVVEQVRLLLLLSRAYIIDQC
jgi:hypothetical protein